MKKNIRFVVCVCLCIYTVNAYIYTHINKWCFSSLMVRKIKIKADLGDSKTNHICRMRFTVSWHQQLILTWKLIHYQLEVKMEMGGKDSREPGTCMFLTCADVPPWWLKLSLWFRRRCVNRRFTPLSSQGLQTLEVNEAWSVKTSWDGMS